MVIDKQHVCIFSLYIVFSLYIMFIYLYIYPFHIDHRCRFTLRPIDRCHLCACQSQQRADQWWENLQVQSAELFFFSMCNGLVSGMFPTSFYHGFFLMKYRRVQYWLVVWLPFCIFPYIGNFIIPIDGLIFFRGVQPQPPTRIIVH